MSTTGSSIMCGGSDAVLHARASKQRHISFFSKLWVLAMFLLFLVVLVLTVLLLVLAVRTGEFREFLFSIGEMF